MFDSKFVRSESIEVPGVQAGTISGVYVAAHPAPRGCSRGRGGYDWRDFRLTFGWGNLVRLAFLPLWRTFGSGSRNWRTAACHAFLQWDLCGDRRIGEWTIHEISLNTYKIFLPLAAAVPGSARELLEAPLNAQLCPYPDRCLDPYTCPADRLVFHARRNLPQSSAWVFPRRFHQRHHRRPELGHNCTHSDPSARD
jgi:hypothetical protein